MHWPDTHTDFVSPPSPRALIVGLSMLYPYRHVFASPKVGDDVGVTTIFSKLTIESSFNLVLYVFKGLCTHLPRPSASRLILGRLDDIKVLKLASD